jgi:lysyl-tRNA synthetase class 2
MTFVSSTAILRMDWYEGSETLVINMRDGSRLMYTGVPQGVYEDFQAAGSKGQYFNYEIRDKYPFSYG